MTKLFSSAKLTKLRASKVEKESDAQTRLSGIISPDDSQRESRSLSLDEENALLDKELGELKKVRQSLTSATGKKKKKKKKANSDDHSAMESVGTPGTKRKKKKKPRPSEALDDGNEIVYDDDDGMDMVDSLPLADTPKKKKKKKKSSDESVVSEMTTGTKGTKKKKKKKKVSVDGEDGDGDESTIATNRSSGTMKKKIRNSSGGSKSRSSRRSNVTALTEGSGDDGDRVDPTSKSLRASERVSALGDLLEGEDDDNSVPATPNTKKKKKKKKLGDDKSVGTMGTKGTKGTKKMRKKKKSEASGSDIGTLNDLIEGNTISFDMSNMGVSERSERSLGMRGISERGERSVGIKKKKKKNAPSDGSALTELVEEDGPELGITMKVKSKASGDGGAGSTYRKKLRRVVASDDDSVTSDISMSTFDKTAADDVDDELKPIRRGRKSQPVNQETSGAVEPSPVEPTNDAEVPQERSSVAQSETAMQESSQETNETPPVIEEVQDDPAAAVAQPEALIQESSQENEEVPPVTDEAQEDIVEDQQTLELTSATSEEVESPVSEEEPADDQEQPHMEEKPMERDQSQEIDPTNTSPVESEVPIKITEQAGPSTDDTDPDIAASSEEEIPEHIEKLAEPAASFVPLLGTTLDSTDASNDLVMEESIAEPETLATANSSDEEVPEPVKVSEPIQHSKNDEIADEMGGSSEVITSRATTPVHTNIAASDSGSEDEVVPLEPATDSSENIADPVESDVIQDRDDAPLQNQEDESMSSSSSESEAPISRNPLKVVASKTNYLARDLKEKAEDIKENKPVVNAVRGAVEEFKAKQPIKTKVEGLVKDIKEKKSSLEAVLGNAVDGSEPSESDEEETVETEPEQLETPEEPDEVSESSESSDEDTVLEEGKKEDTDPEELKKMVAAEKARVDELLEELVLREGENAAERLALQTENESLSKEKELIQLQTYNLKHENEQMDRAILMTEYRLEDLRDDDCESDHDVLVLEIVDENDALKEQLEVYTNFVRKLREDEFERLQDDKNRMLEIMEEGEEDHSDMDDNTLGPIRDINMEEKEEAPVVVDVATRVKIRGHLLKVAADLKESNSTIEHNRLAIENLKTKVQQTRQENSQEQAMKELNELKDDVKIAELTAMHETEEIKRYIAKEEAGIKAMEEEIIQLNKKSQTYWAWIRGNAEESESESEEEDSEEETDVAPDILTTEESVRALGDAKMQQMLRESKVLMKF
ncbi:MAG: hypothetical protein SGBAC_006798 [Bacillariaceae sp.]